jgi:hypothetical protein
MRTMQQIPDSSRSHSAVEAACFSATARRGFALPVVIFVLVLLSVIATTALVTSGDEGKASQAMYESSRAFYAAEAGLNAVLASWPDSAVDELEPGGILDLGWQSLPDGAQYRAEIRRTDFDRIEESYSITVESRGANPRAGQRVLRLLVKDEVAATTEFGECCEAAITMRRSPTEGAAELREFAEIDGTDYTHPSWDSAGVCSLPERDMAGVIADDTVNFNDHYHHWDQHIIGGEPLLTDTVPLTDDSFQQFGDLTWEDLRSMVDHTIDHKSGKDLDITIGPSLNPDGTCNTDDKYNWGTNDPTHPCWGYVPVIRIRNKEDISVRDGEGNAIILLDDEYHPEYNPEGEGADFRLHAPYGNTTLSGLIIGRGCVKIDGTRSSDALNGHFYGAIMIDGTRQADSCWPGETLTMDDYGTARWSSCAVSHVLTHSAVAEYLDGGGIKPLGERAFQELIR